MVIDNWSVQCIPHSLCPVTNNYNNDSVGWCWLHNDANESGVRDFWWTDTSTEATDGETTWYDSMINGFIYNMLGCFSSFNSRVVHWEDYIGGCTTRRVLSSEERKLGSEAGDGTVYMIHRYPGIDFASIKYID